MDLRWLLLGLAVVFAVGLFVRHYFAGGVPSEYSAEFFGRGGGVFLPVTIDGRTYYMPLVDRHVDVALPADWLDVPFDSDGNYIYGISYTSTSEERGFRLWRVAVSPVSIGSVSSLQNVDDVTSPVYTWFHDNYEELFESSVGESNTFSPYALDGEGSVGFVTDLGSFTAERVVIAPGDPPHFGCAITVAPTKYVVCDDGYDVSGFQGGFSDGTRVYIQEGGNTLTIRAGESTVQYTPSQLFDSDEYLFAGAAALEIPGIGRVLYVAPVEKQPDELPEFAVRFFSAKPFIVGADGSLTPTDSLPVVHLEVVPVECYDGNAYDGNDHFFFTVTSFRSGDINFYRFSYGAISGGQIFQYNILYKEDLLLNPRRQEDVFYTNYGASEANIYDDRAVFRITYSPEYGSPDEKDLYDDVYFVRLLLYVRGREPVTFAGYVRPTDGDLVFSVDSNVVADYYDYAMDNNRYLFAFIEQRASADRNYAIFPIRLYLTQLTVNRIRQSAPAQPTYELHPLGAEKENWYDLEGEIKPSPSSLSAIPAPVLTAGFLIALILFLLLR